jgi:hypothetical protein
MIQIMPEQTTVSAKVTGEPPPLIFEWDTVKGVKRRLAFWLLIVAAGHVALFYFFRVAPPVVSRKPPPQHTLLFLPSAGQAVRSVLGAVDDRWPGSVQKSSDYDWHNDLAALAKATPPLDASWTAHRAALKPFPQPLVPLDLPPLVQPGEPLLPETAPPPALSVTQTPARREPAAVIEEPPGTREIVQPVEWPANLIDDSWPAGGTVALMLGIARDGRPEYCLALSPAAGVDLELLRGPLMKMRFAPAASGGLQWLRVAVRW